MNADVILNYSSLIEKLRHEQKSFVLATVIQVHGSASARIGSKAIFDHDGKNIFGWVGGGCAERFVGEQAIECLNENRGRVVLADLDDEIFGLGVACGGKMQVFIDPIVPLEKISLGRSPKIEKHAETFAQEYGIHLSWNNEGKSLQTMGDFFLALSDSVARHRGRSAVSLREVKDLPVRFAPMRLQNFNSSIALLGSGRIVEALSAHFLAVGWKVRVLGAAEQFDIRYQTGECVLIASHSSRDRELVQKAIEAKLCYVGMIGSRKRALEIINHLQLASQTGCAAPLFVPAGLDLDARNPNEIALSIVAEILTQIQKATAWI